MKISITREESMTQMDLSHKAPQNGSWDRKTHSGSHRCSLTQQFLCSLMKWLFRVLFLPSVEPDSTLLFFCSQRWLPVVFRPTCSLSTLHVNKRVFCGHSFRRSKFLSRSPQQMSLYDSLIQTEFLDLTALCSVVRFAGYFWPIIVGLVTESVPSLTPGEIWQQWWLEGKIQSYWRRETENDTGGQQLTSGFAFSFSGSEWSPLPLILLTDLLW